MPLAIFALTIAAYAIGTTEFVIVGLLPTVASDLHITLPLAGLIVSVYALGVTFGAPILTALAGKIERKPLLLGLMVLFVVGNAIAALSPNYELLLVARVIVAFAHGVFFSVGSTIAADLVPENRRASAIAMMFMGLTVAIVTGVPIGVIGRLSAGAPPSGRSLLSASSHFSPSPPCCRTRSERQQLQVFSDQLRLGSGRCCFSLR